jgi:ProP effector
VASGLPRHDLQAQPVEPVAPEHVHHAILELYRRKSTTPQEPAARQRAVAQLVAAIERSGLGRDGYNERFGAAPAGRELLDEALAAIGQQAAKQEALRRAFTASGKSVEEFADMYGMPVADVQRLVRRPDRDTTIKGRPRAAFSLAAALTPARSAARRCAPRSAGGWRTACPRPR